MPEKLKTALSRGGISLLLSLGLTLPALFALSLGDYWLTAAGLMVGATAVMAAAGLHKWGKWVLLAGALAWAATDLLVSSGQSLSTVVQVFKAIYLHLSGQPAALPLYGTECVVILSCLFAVSGYLMCAPGAGFYPALAISLMVLMTLWLAGRQDLLAYCLPALCALVVLYARSVHEDLPAKRILPLAAVAVALAFFLMPSQGIVSPAMQKTAQDIRQRIMDYLFFTEPRNVFSLSSEGYYPQGPQQLGGPAEPTDHPVMRVRTDKKVLLRGAVKDTYTGRVWQDTTGGRRYLFISPRWQGLKASLLNLDLPQGTLAEAQSLLRESTISIQMLSPSASTLFTPQRVRRLEMMTGDMVPYFNNASELFITRDLQEGDTYTVTAPLIQAGDPGLGTLVTACQSAQDGQYASVYEMYTALPGHLEEQLYEMTARITANYETPYDKALAIQNYLSRYYTYNLNVEAPPGNYDFVSYFLLRGREGYCTYFASAMTVLCRMAGLPARYIEGYLCQPGSDHVAYVTGLNAHAWTEVYFEGFGWLAFDATPSQSNQSPDETPPEDPQDANGSENEEPSPSPEPEDQPSPPPPDGEPSQEPDTPPPDNEPSPEPDAATPPPEEDGGEKENEPPANQWGWWLALLLLLTAALCAMRVWETLPATRARKEKTDQGRVKAWTQASFDLLKTYGLARRPTETLLAFGARADRENLFSASITTLCEEAALFSYSPHPMTKEDAELAKGLFEDLYRRLPWHKKARMALYRAAVPKRKADFTRN